MRLLALAGLLALSVSAHADLLPGDYNVFVNGGNQGTGGYTTTAVANIPGVGVVHFSAFLTSTTATFQFASGQVLGPPNPVFQLNTVEFASRFADPHIIGFTLDPSSTVTGIVPSASASNLGNTIDFNFTNATEFPGGTATFALSFAPQAAPEIDPSLTSSGLVLLAGAIAILRKRRPCQAA